MGITGAICSRPKDMGACIFKRPLGFSCNYVTESSALVARVSACAASSLLSVGRTLGQSIGIASIGALWASRVSAYAGKTLSGGITTASTEVQMNALQDTFFSLVFIIVIALFLSIWSIIREQRFKNNSSVKR
jgi:hypothetical protein